MSSAMEAEVTGDRRSPIKLRDDFAHSLGGTGGGGDDVLAGTTAISPQLAGWAVHCLLGGCDGMNCALEREERREGERGGWMGGG